jgi:N-methylhydantoinase B
MWKFGREGAEPEPVPPKTPVMAARKGEIYRAIAGNGGGTGPPAERDPERVLRDYRDELISVEEAREVYSVAIDSATRQIDEEETRKLREG